MWIDLSVLERSDFEGFKALLYFAYTFSEMAMALFAKKQMEWYEVQGRDRWLQASCFEFKVLARRNFPEDRYAFSEVKKEDCVIKHFWNGKYPWIFF